MGEEMSRVRLPLNAMWPLEVFYDGACPICAREINFVRRLDRRGRLRFTDIASPTFRACEYGMPLESFMSEIKGRQPDGTWIQGVEVIRRLYVAIGLGGLVWVTRLPIVSGLLDKAYRLFARLRPRLKPRCSENSVACKR